MQRERPLLIGIGNPYRGDDAVGPLVIELIGRRKDIEVDLEVIRGDCAALAQHLSERNNIVIVDACSSGAAAGTVHHFDALASEFSAYRGSVSSHGFGVAESIALAKAMGTMPKSCSIFAIEGHNFETTDAMSEPVRNSVNSLVSDLLIRLKSD